MTEPEIVTPADGRELATFGEAGARIVGVFHRPEATFTAIRRVPSWGLALLLLCLTSLAIKLVVEPRVSPESLRTFLEERGATGEQIEEAMEAQLSPSGARSFVSSVSAVGGAGLFYVVATAIFFALARLMGSEIDFKRALAVTTHGLLPFALATLIAIPVVISRGSIDFQETFSGNFLASHAGALAGEETGAVAMALLSSVDLFSIWCIALLVIGFRTVGGLSRGAALVTVLLPWIVAVGLKVGIAALLSGAA